MTLSGTTSGDSPDSRLTAAPSSSRRRPNVPHAKLHGQGPRAYASAARRLLTCVLASAQVKFAADVTPRRFCSAEALQRRIEAGPWQLQRGVSRRCGATPRYRQTLECNRSKQHGHTNGLGDAFGWL